MSTPRPLIGLTTSEMRTPVRDEELPHAEAGLEEMVLNFHYMRGVTRAGGLPVVMSPQPLEAVPDLIGRLDALLVPGGPDIDPASYGDVPRAPLGPLFPEIDRFEIACVREAERRGLPLLAICRGMQILNVARGGTLWQDLPTEVPSDVLHRRPNLDQPVPMHRVRIEPGSHLARLLDRTEADVNAYHHQAPRELGEGLRPVAWAEDGVIEGVEDDGFVVGVQWHAEAMQDVPEQRGLFAGLVEAAAT
ncbi:MAG: gamma-glutamyl-gamma-aminobutyrate hydrolase family protein [Actinomycetota bacterium]|nr:gamma-glutamyl-gamma-aminobutyrate hydrolase family protein [Actinomycetota bacterium]